MSIEPVMSGFLRNFISPESHDKAGSPDSKIIEYTQIIFVGNFFLDVYLRWTQDAWVYFFHYNIQVGLLPAEGTATTKKMLYRFNEEQLQGLWHSFGMQGTIEVNLPTIGKGGSFCAKTLLMTRYYYYDVLLKMIAQLNQLLSCGHIVRKLCR
jgi:hypothetical protein